MRQKASRELEQQDACYIPTRHNTQNQTSHLSSCLRVGTIQCDLKYEKLPAVATARQKTMPP